MIDTSLKNDQQHIILTLSLHSSAKISTPQHKQLLKIIRSTPNQCLMETPLNIWSERNNNMINTY